MLRRLIRAVATLLIFTVIGVIIVAATGGAFRLGGGVASCPAPVDQGGGPIPDLVRGGYEVSLMLQAGDIVVRPAATLQVEPDTVKLTANQCQTDRRGRG